MAQIDRPLAFPNLLHIHGADVVNSIGDGTFSLRRADVKNALFSDTNSVGNFRGEVDFIHCYLMDSNGSDHAGVDHAPAGEAPPLRPLRGIIREMHNLRSPFTDQKLAEHMGGIGHEMAHYWLVPGQARLQIGSTEVETPTSDEIAASLNNGKGIPPVPMIGRQDAHWSPYIHSEGSFMDGINHQFDSGNPVSERLYGFSKSQGVETMGVPFDFEGTELTTKNKLSDFELYLMGLPPLTGGPSDRVLQVMEPNWVFPLQFHAGLYLELEDGQVWYCGFHSGPDRIRAQPVTGVALPETWLTAPFDPYHRVAFRIVQIGGEVDLQARVYEPQRLGARGCLYEILVAIGGLPFLKPKPPPDISREDILSAASFAPASADVYGTWRSLARLTSKVKRMGIGARHLSGGCFARIRPKVLCLLEGGTVTDPLPPLVTENEPAYTDSSWGSSVLADGSLVLPYRIGPNVNVYLPHDAATDAAPRRVMAAPKGDFVFGGELELCQCTLVSWAGGGGAGKTYVGRRREIAYSDVNYLAHWGDEYESIRQAEPAGGAYRFLFCLVSQDPLSAAVRDSQLTELDRARRAWEAAFVAMTSGRRGADTTIPF